MKALPQLYALEISDTPISGNGLRHLKDCMSLRTLYLAETKIDDSVVETLGTISGLTELHLTGSQITAEGRKRLRTLLPKTTVTPEN